MALNPIWTKEDETASQGRFDPRPVLMIHFPGQQTEQDVTAPFDEIRIHEIIESLLRGQAARFRSTTSSKTIAESDGVDRVPRDRFRYTS